MRAQVLFAGKNKLELREDFPKPLLSSPYDVLIRILYCGICRTDLHILDQELHSPKLPLIPGHQIVGVIEEIGSNVTHLKLGECVGIAWLASACGECLYCKLGKENLCDKAIFTGYTRDGGYAEYCVADSRFIFPLEQCALATAPLLCAGLIGYRALKMTENAETVGFFGFGSSAHILLQILHFQNKKVYAFTRPGDLSGQAFAKELGAFWSGDTNATPRPCLDAAIIFAPAGELIPKALQWVRKGGIVVCAGIHMTPIPTFSYELLWEERTVKSVANLTREDGREFFSLISKMPLNVEVTAYPLDAANEALQDLKHGKYHGSGVLDLH